MLYSDYISFFCYSQGFLGRNPESKGNLKGVGKWVKTHSKEPKSLLYISPTCHFPPK